MDHVGDWAWSVEHEEACRILELQELWNGTSYRVWLPKGDRVVRLRADQIRAPANAAPTDAAWLEYVIAAARVADALSQDLLLSPIESSVIPLPHQIRALSRAVSDDRIRYLLADEVGLGKTIEAGLIMRELKLRGLIRRTLVVAPKGLVTQWVAEMETHFGEDFRLLIPSEFSAFRRALDTDNVWDAFDQVVCPMDSVKPSDGRRGWSREQLERYNRERFEDLITAGWDLIIVDEAHRLGGSTDQVARHRLGQGLADAAPHLLLLSATPHQGKTEPFHRLMSLLDERAFPDPESISRDRVRPYVIRTEKRQAIDAEGDPLFKPRSTRLVPVAWEARHQRQRALYHAVSEYVREGYNQAVEEKQNYLGFLLLLMQRLVTSSTRAIRATLERRLEALALPDEQLALFPALTDEEWADLDGQEQVDTLLATRLKALRDERSEVRLLLDAARQVEEAGPDAKAEALLSWIYRLQREEGNPRLKVLVFTEFVPTQQMLSEFLTDRGFSVVCLNGSMGMAERNAAQEAFAGEVRIMVSTEAGGEGLNLQFCHVVINYDIPWNPMRLEQRIGRVDRIGQEHPVRAVNLTLEETVEHRVLEVLENKLTVILEEFGVDKTGDILDSAEAARLFDDLYTESILDPDQVDAKIEETANHLREEGRGVRESSSVLGDGEELDPKDAQRLLAHPFPHWVEAMTTSYLRARGGAVQQRGKSWKLKWPDNADFVKAVFSFNDARREPGARHLTLADRRVRELVEVPRFAPGQAIPVIRLSGLPADIYGTWSLWRITLTASDWRRDRIMPLLVHDDGRVLPPSARFIWDRLLEETSAPAEFLTGAQARQLLEDLKPIARGEGRDIYEELLREHRDRIAREKTTAEYAFAARRRAVERVGLPAVRDHRALELEAEKAEWKQRLEERKATTPGLEPLLLMRIEAEG